MAKAREPPLRALVRQDETASSAEELEVEALREAVLLAVLRAVGPTERAERRHDLANMVMESWLKAWRGPERVNWGV